MVTLRDMSAGGPFLGNVYNAVVKNWLK